MQMGRHGPSPIALELRIVSARGFWHGRRVELAAAGFDIAHRFAARDLASEPGLEHLALATHPVGLLVGNTRALWSRFAAARASDPALAEAPDPIDRYTEQVIAPLAEQLGVRVYFAHVQYDGAYLPFQRLAVVAGLAALSPAQLLVHREFGPWFALRAVILAPGEAPTSVPRTELPCRCAERGCVAAFDRAMATPADWRAWIAVREACPIGRAYRYSDDQLAYHYSKDPQYLP
jgi:hypothetical protein